MMRLTKTYGGIFLAFAIVGLLRLVFPAAFLIHVVIFSIYTMAFSFLMGRLGLVSFGQPVYMGIAAYGTGLYLHYLGTNPFLGMLVGIIVGIAFAAVIGALFVRLSSSYFTLANLALCAIGFFVFQRALVHITRGDTGLWYLGRMSPGLLLNFRNPDHILAFALIIAAAIWVFMQHLDRSVFGATCLAVKANERKLQFLGYDTYRIKWLGFVIANSIAAVAGTLYAVYFGFVSPAIMDVLRAPEVVVVGLLGGVGTLYGPLIGTFVYVAMQDLVSAIFVYWELVVGMLLILVMMAGEKGIASLLEYPLLARMRKRHDGRRPSFPSGHPEA
ncbi:MAG TPA: branched-chain amino acid ABC transporter permease [Bacillota bacterium]|nr:branched-chain amino acid ABC transporter permease [Bacillota bacterium]